MTLNWSILSHFSCPQVRGDGRIASSIVEALAHAAVTPVQLNYAARGGRWGEVANVLGKWLDQPAEFSALWRTSISKIARVSGECEPARLDDYCARLLLDIADQLEDFSTPAIGISDAPLLVRGHLIWGMRSVTLNKAGSVLTISSPSGRECYEFSGRRLSRWPRQRRSVKVTLDRAIQFIETNQSAAEISQESSHWSPLRGESVGRFGRTGRIGEALGLLASEAPHYAQWVRSAIGTIIVVPGEEKVSCSGSWSDTAGTIYLSEPGSAIEAAEVLVHEASHQHFNLARHLGAVHTDNGRLYYSPPVRKERPLDRILIAYHAFGNVLIFYRRISRMNTFPKDVEAQVRKCRQYVEVLEGHLLRTRALTPLGKAIFKPLRDALRQSSGSGAFGSGRTSAIPGSLPSAGSGESRAATLVAT